MTSSAAQLQEAKKTSTLESMMARSRTQTVAKEDPASALRSNPIFSVVFSPEIKTEEKAHALASILASPKDEQAKILGRPLFIYDMGEYSEKNAGAKLIGAVPGYELAGVGGQLTNAALEFPYGIFVFDEIEKAHDNIFNTFLSLLSDGRLTDNVGRKCSFKKAIVGFTSNIGQPRFLDMSLTPDEQRRLATEDLNKFFRGEFLNRFAGRENIIWFDTLGIDSLNKIVKREFNSINDAYSDRERLLND